MFLFANDSTLQYSQKVMNGFTYRSHQNPITQWIFGLGFILGDLVFCSKPCCKVANVGRGLVNKWEPLKYNRGVL
jgi:hypothetical protein